MNPTTEGLRELHRLQIALKEIDDRLTNGPRRIAAAARKCAAKEQALTDQKKLITELRKSADGSSLQLKSNEAKIADLKGKLNMASSNKEYDIIKSQIDADEMANSVLEDEILEALEKVDIAVRQSKAYEDECAALNEKKKEIEAEVNESAAGLESQAQQLRTQIAEGEEVIPNLLRTTYQRLVEAHGATALAPVDKTSCLECYSVITSQERVELNTGKVILCRNCGRIMFAGEST